jgi:hypothetical protein
MKKAIIPFIFILLLLCDINASDGKVFGKVSFVEGKAWVIRKFKKTPLKAGDSLFYKDQVKTGGNSRLKIEKSKGNEIIVNEKTNLKLNTDNGKANTSVVQLLSGGVRCRLKNLKGAGFKVKTPVAVAGVRGTDFLVTYNP